MKPTEMFLTAVRKMVVVLTLLIPTAIPIFAVDEGKILIYGAENESQKNLERTLEAILHKVPKAAKLFEYRDQHRVMFLVKLSEHSFGMIQESGSGGHTWSVLNATTSVVCSLSDNPRKIDGEFKYKINDPSLGGEVETTYAWAIQEYDLQKDHGRHLIFTFKFSGAQGEPQNSVSIAIDWEAGLAEGIKIVPGNKP